MACKVIVLGAGLVGGPLAADLALDPNLQVSVADRDPLALGRVARDQGITPLQRDLADAAAVRDLVADFDLVVGAMPGWLGGFPRVGSLAVGLGCWWFWCFGLMRRNWR